MRILVAGIGNIFLGDDAFGVEVARRLACRTLPEGVEVADFGIRGFDLACAILDGYNAVIVIDAACRRGEPGTLYVIEPDPRGLAEVEIGTTALEGHDMTLDNVFRLVEALGGELPCLRLVACEPARIGGEGADDEDGDESGESGLSEAVRRALDGAVDLVESLILELRRAAPLGAD